MTIAVGRCTVVGLCCGLALASLTTGCGGGQSAPPTGPTAPAPVIPTALPQAPIGVRVSGFPRPPGTGNAITTFAGRTETIQWTPTPSATSYRITVGLVAQTSDVLDVETTESSYVWSSIPTGTFYVNVLAKNQVGWSQPSIQAFGVTALSRQDYIEALFLGTGSMSPANQSCPGGVGSWGGWRVGTTVVVKLSTTLSTGQRDAARAVLAEIESTVGQRLRFQIAETPDVRPRPAQQELTLTLSTDPTVDCGGGSTACVRPSSDASKAFTSVEGFLSATSNAPLVRHELGHGILGFCHTTLDGDASFLGMMAGAPAEPVMPVADAEVLRLVYGAGLSAGSGREAFISAGLVRP